MNAKSTRRTSRVLLVAALLITAAVAFGTTYDRADAIVISGPNVCSYFSNASYTTVVGARGTGCCGAVINWGVITQYKRCEPLYCLDVVCPN